MTSQVHCFRADNAFWKNQTPVIRGIARICLSTIAFPIIRRLVRFVLEVLHPFNIAFFRNIFGLAYLLPLLSRSRLALLRTNQIGLHALRG